VSIAAGYGTHPVLREVTFDLHAGEIFGLVGQSGSGKSTLALSILGLLDHKHGAVRGSIRLSGRDLLALDEAAMRRVRGREVSLVLQSPLSSLNPALRIETHFGEAWKAHARGSRSDGRERFLRALAEVGLPSERNFLRRFPSQISVGQAQRVLIALAVLHRPALLVADEPTSALDVITQAEILDLFARLNRSRGMGILYISHDLLSVAQLSHRMAILHEGEIAECAPPGQIFGAPGHPYTRRLIASLPGAEKLLALAMEAGAASSVSRA
jgi:ABC-type dipeptide/oligopeptide/nickel transport system ATPase component